MEITRADRHFGTDRVMIFGPDMVQLIPLQGRKYREVKGAVLLASSSKTKFYHRIPSEDPNQPVKEIEVSRKEW